MSSGKFQKRRPSCGAASLDFSREWFSTRWAAHITMSAERQQAGAAQAASIHFPPTTTIFRANGREQISIRGIAWFCSERSAQASISRSVLALTAYTAQPYNEITGRDDNHDGLANDRPPGVRRNSLQGPGYADLDLRWSRDFFLAPAKRDKGPTAPLGLDAFNVLNKVNYMSYIGDLSSLFFGKPVAAQPPRRLQVSLRFRF